MAFEKITDSELESVGVELLDDVPGLSPGAMKAKFEETAKKLLAPKINKLIDALDDMNLEIAVKGSGDVLYLRLNADKVLETSPDGETWQATGSSGHLILNSDGESVPQRSRMQFLGADVKDIGGVTQIAMQKGDKGDAGPQGPVGPQGPAGAQARRAGADRCHGTDRRDRTSRTAGTARRARCGRQQLCGAGAL